VANTVIDQFSDPGFRVLGHLISLYPTAEEHIKTAALDLDENEDRPDTAFAWQERRLFPIDSADQAALSRLYIHKQASAVPEDVVALCDKALELYNVDMPLQVKTASAPVDDSRDYLLPQLKRWKVIDADGVKLASEAIMTNRRRMDTGSRATASVNLAKKAAEFGVPLPKTILKMAGATMCDTKVLRDWLEARSTITTDAQIKFGYDKLAEEVDQMPLLVGDRDELIKVAAAIQELDESVNLDYFYDQKIPDALDTVFNTEKMADEILSLAGRQVPLSTLEAIDPDVYRDVLGDDLAEDFISSTGEIDEEQLKIVLPTVPRDLLQALFAQMGM
jgi:hypothetical protein